MGAIARPNAPTPPLLPVRFDTRQRDPPTRVMRILHTGDWHIGKRLYGVDRSHEFSMVIDQIAEIARENDVDLIVMSGDIMDRRLVEPLVLSSCLHAFERLSVAAPVVAVTGNHDEPLFWAEIAPYLAPRILVAASEAVFSVDTRAGWVTVACMPWPEPADSARDSSHSRAQSLEAYAELVTGRLAALGRQATAARESHPGPAVLVAHAMVRGGVAGGGERPMTLGGTYAVPGSAFPDVFDYVALGHLHRPQDLASIPTTGRYSGSPMALDFSGDAENPSITIVDLSDDETQTREVALSAARRLVRLRGSIDEMAHAAVQTDPAWFLCEVDDPEVRLDVVRRVRERIPNALRVEQLPHLGVTSELPPVDHEASVTDVVGQYQAWLAQIGRQPDEHLLAALEDSLQRASG